MWRSGEKVGGVVALGSHGLADDVPADLSDEFFSDVSGDASADLLEPASGAVAKGAEPRNLAECRELVLHPFEARDVFRSNFREASQGCRQPLSFPCEAHSVSLLSFRPCA